MGVDDFKETEEAKAVSRRVQDSEDHNNAISGNFDTGRRINRGLRDKSERDRNTTERVKRSLSQALRLSASYAKQYQSTMGNLNNAENTVYDALLRSAERVSEAQSIVQNSLNAASILPDGSEVFLAENGDAYSKNGREIEGEELALIAWREDAPSWEAYQAQVSALDEAEDYHKRMNTYEERLGELRAEMEDKDNPVNEERMTEIDEEFKDIVNDTRIHDDLKTELQIEKPASDLTIKLDL